MANVAPSIPHFLGFGAMGIVHSHLFQKEFSLPIFYLPRPSSTTTPTPTPFIVHEPNGQSTKLDVINDEHGLDSIDVLIVTTKAHQAHAAITPYLKRMNSQTLFVFLQNGMGLVDSLRSILPSNRIVLGTTTHAAYRTEKNAVNWVHRGLTLFGRVQPGGLNRTEFALLSSMGIVIPYLPLELRLFQKLAYSACINPVTAIYNIPNKGITDKLSEAYDLSSRLAGEVRRLYAVLKPEMDMTKLFEEVLQLAQDTGENTSSMLADMQAGRETEIDFINGYIVKMAHKVGVEVYENETVIKRIKEMTSEKSGTAVE